MARLAVLSHIHESFLNNASDNVASLRPERRHIGLADKFGYNARLALKSFNEFREVSPQILAVYVHWFHLLHELAQLSRFLEQ